MALSHDQLPTQTPPETRSTTRETPTRPNEGSGDFGLRASPGELAAQQVLGDDPLAGYYYEGLLSDPLATTRDALFTCYLQDWTGFTAMLARVQRAGLAELALAEPERSAALEALPAGIEAGCRAYREAPLTWELDVLLGLLEPSQVPATATFVEQAYGVEAPAMAQRLADYADSLGDPTRAEQARRLLGPRDDPLGGQSGELDDLLAAFVGAGSAGLQETAEASRELPLLGGTLASRFGELDQGLRFAGGLARGAGALLSGAAELATKPDASLAGLVELSSHIPLSPMWRAKLGESRDIRAKLTEDARYGAALAGALWAPIGKSVDEGDLAGAAGRTTFELGSLFGVGELGAVGKTGKLGRAGEAATVGRVGEEAAALADEGLAAAKHAESPAAKLEEAVVAKAEDAPSTKPEGHAHAEEHSHAEEHAQDKSPDAPSTKQPKNAEEAPGPAKAGAFDARTASDEDLWARATKGGPEGSMARAELKLRTSVGQLSDEALEQLVADGHKNPRMVSLAQRELAARRGLLDAFEALEREGKLQQHLGEFPKPSARTVEASRQLYAAFMEGGVGQDKGLALHVAELSDGGILVGISGAASKAARIRAKVRLPSGMRWAPDEVPFRRDLEVRLEDGSLFLGGPQCGETKTYLGLEEGVSVVSQQANWYGKDNPHSILPNDTGAGSPMAACPSCQQHAVRLIKDSESVRITQ